AGAAAVRPPLRRPRRRSRRLPRTLPRRWPSPTNPRRLAPQQLLKRSALLATPAVRPPTATTPPKALPARPRPDRPRRTAWTGPPQRVGVGQNRRRATTPRERTDHLRRSLRTTTTNPRSMPRPTPVWPRQLSSGRGLLPGARRRGGLPR